MKFLSTAHLVGVAAAAIATPKDLDVNSQKSIRNVAATIAHDTMLYYNGNTSNDPLAVGNVQKPYYWWVAGGLWSMMLDYFQYTKDPSYNADIIQGLLAKVNTGPNHDYMPPEHALEEGNDDLFFWGSAVLAAAEHNFPQPKSELPSWLDLSKNVFKQLESRWDTKHCNGGIFWQIRSDNPNGLTYKNTIANGGFFQIAARLARMTGDDSYAKWAETAWDWSWNLQLIDNTNYHVYDGAGIDSDCKKTNQQAFTYTTAIYLYGAAVMANHTGKAEWAERAEKILDGASWFFWTKGDAKNVLYEAACETVDRCWLGNADMTTFKGFFSQHLWKTAVLLPALRPKIESYLIPSSEAAAKSCSGGTTGTACGERWYTGHFEGKTGLGAQMCALGTIQGLLASEDSIPLSGKGIERISNAQFAPADPNRADKVTTTSQAAAPSPPPTTSALPETTSSKVPPSSAVEQSTPALTTTKAEPSGTTKPNSTSAVPSSISSSTKPSSDGTSSMSSPPANTETNTDSITSSIDSPCTEDHSSTIAAVTSQPTAICTISNECPPDTTALDTTTSSSSEPTKSLSPVTTIPLTTSLPLSNTPSTESIPECSVIWQTETRQPNLTTYVVTPPRPTTQANTSDKSPPPVSAANELTSGTWALVFVSLGTVVAIWGLA